MLSSGSSTLGRRGLFGRKEKADDSSDGSKSGGKVGADGTLMSSGSLLSAGLHSMQSV